METRKEIAAEKKRCGSHNCSKVWAQEKCFANALFAWQMLLSFWKKSWKRKEFMPSQMMNEGVRKYGIRL